MSPRLAEARLYYLSMPRWIDFSEGEGRGRRRRKDQATELRLPFANALRTTRSTNIFWQQADSVVKLANMKIYQTSRNGLHHRVPDWVERGALFHVRIALDREKEQRAINASGAGQGDFGFRKIL